MAATNLSRQYYAVAPYHHDSAAARLYAVKLHRQMQADGLWPALRDLLRGRDSLEPAVRLLAAPSSLTRLRGHLVTCVPLLALFLALVGRYVGEGSGSAALAVAATLLLPCFPYVYDPIHGFSDYWRESSASWLLGSAVACWLLGDGLTRRGWGTASGALLGALFMTRTVAAVYGAAVFVPLVFRAAVAARGPSVRRALAGRLILFAGLAAGGAFLTAALAGGKLYSYYFVTAWNFGSQAEVARYMAAAASEQLGLGALVVAAVLGLCAPWRRPAWLEAAWLVVAVPAAVVASGGFYHGAFALATPLMVLAGARALLECRVPARRAAAILIACALGTAIGQYSLTRRQALAVAERSADTRRFYERITAAVLANPAARYGLVYEALDTIFVNHAFFDRGVWPTGTVAFHTIADSYYRRQFAGLSAAEAARRNLDALERQVGTIAVTHCTPADIPASLDAQPFSRAAGAAVSEALRQSPRWRARQRFASPFGCLLLYEYADRDLPPSEKWREVGGAVSGP